MARPAARSEPGALRWEETLCFLHIPYYVSERKQFFLIGLIVSSLQFALGGKIMYNSLVPHNGCVQKCLFEKEKIGQLKVSKSECFVNFCSADSTMEDTIDANEQSIKLCKAWKEKCATLRTMQMKAALWMARRQNQSVDRWIVCSLYQNQIVQGSGGENWVLLFSAGPVRKETDNPMNTLNINIMPQSLATESGFVWYTRWYCNWVVSAASRPVFCSFTFFAIGPNGASITRAFSCLLYLSFSLPSHERHCEGNVPWNHHTSSSAWVLYMRCTHIYNVHFFLGHYFSDWLSSLSLTAVAQLDGF